MIPGFLGVAHDQLQLTESRRRPYAFLADAQPDTVERVPRGKPHHGCQHVNVVDLAVDRLVAGGHLQELEQLHEQNDVHACVVIELAASGFVVDTDGPAM